jgi:hypothetical protein
VAAAFDWQHRPDGFRDVVEKHKLTVERISPVHQTGLVQGQPTLTRAQAEELLKGGTERARQHCAAEQAKGSYHPGGESSLRSRAVDEPGCGLLHRDPAGILTTQRIPAWLRHGWCACVRPRVDSLHDRLLEPHRPLCRGRGVTMAPLPQLAPGASAPGAPCGRAGADADGVVKRCVVAAALDRR